MNRSAKWFNEAEFWFAPRGAGLPPSWCTIFRKSGKPLDGAHRLQPIPNGFTCKSHCLLVCWVRVVLSPFASSWWDRWPEKDSKDTGLATGEGHQQRDPVYQLCSCRVRWWRWCYLMRNAYQAGQSPARYLQSWRVPLSAALMRNIVGVNHGPSPNPYSESLQYRAYFALDLSMGLPHKSCRR